MPLVSQHVPVRSKRLTPHAPTSTIRWRQKTSSKPRYEIVRIDPWLTPQGERLDIPPAPSRGD